MNVPQILSQAAQESALLTQGYLLVEPATISYAPFLKAVSSRPCTPRVLVHREELMPRLIDLSAVAPDVQAQLTDLWQEELNTDRPPVACAWIESATGIDELAAHVARHLVGPGQDGKPIFWRFYDPRVFSLALAVLDQDQRNTLPGPVRSWQFAWAGYRWNVSGLDEPPEEIEHRASAWPRPNQWSRIERSEIAARVLDRLTPMRVDEAQRLPAALDRILTDVSTRGGLTSTDDLADYAWHCVHYGSGFEQHSMLVDAWPALVNRDAAWNDVKARFTTADFKAFTQSTSTPPV